MVHEKIIDTAKVLGINTVATGITIIDINSYLSTLSILAALSFTIWKWQKDYKKRENEKSK